MCMRLSKLKGFLIAGSIFFATTPQALDARTIDMTLIACGEEKGCCEEKKSEAKAETKAEGKSDCCENKAASGDCCQNKASTGKEEQKASEVKESKETKPAQQEGTKEEAKPTGTTTESTKQSFTGNQNYIARSLVSADRIMIAQSEGDDDGMGSNDGSDIGLDSGIDSNAASAARAPVGDDDYGSMYNGDDSADEGMTQAGEPEGDS